MKKTIVIVIGVMIVFTLVGCSTAIKGGNLPVDDKEYAQEATIENEKSEDESADWDYPIKDWETAQKSGLDFMGWKDICNPPADILNSLSTEELTYFTLHYPLFPYMPGGATDSEAQTFIGAYLGYSTIFEELMEREDRNEYILAEFAQSVPDIDSYNEGDYFNQSIWVEIFMDQYLLVYSKDLTLEERNIYLKTVHEKNELYYSNIVESNVVFGLLFDEDGLAYRKGYEGRE